MIVKKGTVTKISGTQTIAVEVYDYRAHPKYKKQYRVTRKFLVHDPETKGSVGDYVEIEQMNRRVSKRKAFILKSVITASAA
ncbi:MAG TPA: uS17 family ribosomal protein [Candidatus Gracilibacteria bacterium]